MKQRITSTSSCPSLASRAVCFAGSMPSTVRASETPQPHFTSLLLLLGRIAEIASDSGLLLQTEYSVASVLVTFVSTAKTAELIEMPFGGWLWWSEERWGSRSDESVCSRERCQVGNAAFCQITLDTSRFYAVAIRYTVQLNAEV